MTDNNGNGNGGVDSHGRSLKDYRKYVADTLKSLETAVATNTTRIETLETGQTNLWNAHNTFKHNVLWGIIGVLLAIIGGMATYILRTIGG